MILTSIIDNSLVVYLIFITLYTLSFLVLFEVRTSAKAECEASRGPAWAFSPGYGVL